MSEHDEQVALFQWSAAQTATSPELSLLFAIPNAGKRSVRAAMWAKAEGLRAGVPDMLLPVARDGQHGLFIEMKIGRNRPRENQAWWLDQLHAQGYLAVVCYSWYEAAEVIKKYLEA